MKTRTALLPVLLVLAAGSALGRRALRHTVVQTDRGTILLQKRFVALRDTWVDAGGWSYADYRARPDLAQAMREQGYGDLLLDLRVRDAKAQADALSERAGQAVRGWLREAAVWLKELPEALFGDGDSPVTPAV